jgi:hypothetical protein
VAKEIESRIRAKLAEGQEPPLDEVIGAADDGTDE